MASMVGFVADCLLMVFCGVIAHASFLLLDFVVTVGVGGAMIGLKQLEHLCSELFETGPVVGEIYHSLSGVVGGLQL